MNGLGISFSKEEIKDIITKPVKVAQINKIDVNNEEDYENVSLVDNAQWTGKLQQENECFGTDIAAMEQFGMIDEGDCGKIKDIFKCTEKTTIQMFTKIESNQLQQQKNKLTLFVTHNNKTCKTTAVWLFQECEKVSTNHLFRVKSTQPYSADCTLEIKSLQESTLPKSNLTVK